MSSKTPDQYKQSLNELDSRYNVILNELTNAYPYAKTYPNQNKYTSAYQKDESNLTKLQSDLFLLLDNLQGDISSVSNTIARYVKQIGIIEEQNKELMIELQSITNLGDGAIQAYQDSNFVYNYSFYENIVFFFMISGLGFTFYKSMTKGNLPN